MLSSILKEEPSSITELRHDVPMPLARIVERALAKQPDRRYQSVADLRHDLEDLCHDLDGAKVVTSSPRSGVHGGGAAVLGSFATTYGQLAEAYTDVGRLEEALPELDRAREIDPDPARAVAHAALGREVEAQRAHDAFFELLSGIEIPPGLERSVRNQVEGLMAHARGDWSAAAERLALGLAELPDRRTSEQAIWLRYRLGRALERLDRPGEAAEQYRAIVDATLQRTGFPIFWARALDHLATILDARGDTDEAERLWERYLEHWGDGDIDRERVAEVRARLG